MNETLTAVRLQDRKEESEATCTAARPCILSFTRQEINIYVFVMIRSSSKYQLPKLPWFFYFTMSGWNKLIFFSFFLVLPELQKHKPISSTSAHFSPLVFGPCPCWEAPGGSWGYWPQQASAGQSNTWRRRWTARWYWTAAIPGTDAPAHSFCHKKEREDLWVS